MQIRMLRDNCQCWKAGDVFTVWGCPGQARIECNEASVIGGHGLLDDKGNEMNFDEVRNCKDFEVLEEPAP